MSNIRVFLHRLSTNIATLKALIKTETRTNDYSLNVLMETKMLELYNIVSKLELVNANTLSRNSTAVDGVDKKNKIAAQITSTYSAKKINDTIDNFLELNLYKEYPRLIFLVISEKKKISEALITKIQKKTKGKFQFEASRDILTIDDIYSLYHGSDNLPCIHKAVGILDEVLKFVPDEKESGFDAIGICFHDEELRNVSILVESILKTGVNVYTTSQALYNHFNKSRLKDYLIFTHEHSSISHIDYYITVLSKSFVTRIISKDTDFCRLFTYAVETDIRNEIITFDFYLKNIDKIINRSLTKYQTIEVTKTDSLVKEILESRLKESTFGKIDFEEIKQELVKMHLLLDKHQIIEETNFCLLNLEAPGQDDFKINFLILNKDFNLTNAKAEFDRYKDGYIKNLNILVPKDFSHTTRKRLKTVMEVLNTQRAYFIDEYLFEKRCKSLIVPPILSDSDTFIYPVVKSNGSHKHIADIVHWVFSNSDSSIAIISGMGGIGKTTVSEKLHDMILTEKQILPIFIGSRKYIELLKKGSNGTMEYDLYNIFCACFPNAHLIDKNSFYLNYSLGNIIIIFDGIDEVISTLPNFTLDCFIENLSGIRRSLGRGKILINCRDLYVSELKSRYGTETRFIEFELLGFNERLAKDFFSVHISNPKSVTSCLKLVQEFYPNDISEYRYPPFILEIVVQIIDNEPNFEHIDPEFNSQILQPDEKSDQIIYKICNREFYKKEKNGFQLSIDDQVRLFCEVAIEERGIIDGSQFKLLINRIGITDRVKQVENGLKDHPILKSHDGLFSFRYEFFTNYFKSVAIFNLLCTPYSLTLTEEVISCLAQDCNHNSLISNLLIDKANTCDILFSDCLKFTKEVIKNIMLKTGSAKGGLVDIRMKSISNILVILLSSKKASKYSNEYVLQYLFKDEEGYINSFYFIDVPMESRILFDFSDMYFRNSTIINYWNFLNCGFDADTLFDNSCEILKVFDIKINARNSSASSTNFDKEIKGDNSIHRAMMAKKHGNDFSPVFKEYLSFFFDGNIPKNGIYENTIVTQINNLISTALLTDVLTLNGVIVDHDDDKLYLNDKLRWKVSKFINQGLSFKELNRAITDLKTVIVEEPVLND